MTTNKAKINLDEYEEYTERELQLIDKYIALSNNTLEDEEVYDLITKYNFDEERIREAVLEHVALLNKKGNDFAWTAIAKGKKVKTQETLPPVENKQKNNKNQRRNRDNHYNYTQNYQDQGGNQNFQENRHGSRGNRRGRARGNRGNRGGKRNVGGDFVETHLDQPQTNIETNTLNTLSTHPVETLHEDTTVIEIQNNVETLIQDTPNSKPNNTSEHNQLLSSNPASNSAATNNNPSSSLHSHELQNVESLFQKFTIERESEVNKLLEEKKPVKVERDPKAFYEECVNHYIRDLTISHGSPVTYKGVAKPVQQQSKHTINQQPQVNLNQTTIPQQNQSIPTNKNFPQKGGFGQPSQTPENYYNPQMMYPFMYGNQGMDTNLPNPNFFPQMNMLYFMNQMQQQHFMNQSQMDPEYLESMKGQKGGRSHPYQPRDNMGFMNPFFANQGGNQPESQGYMRPDNYYGYSNEK